MRGEKNSVKEIKEKERIKGNYDMKDMWRGEWKDKERKEKNEYERGKNWCKGKKKVKE